MYVYKLTCLCECVHVCNLFFLMDCPPQNNEIQVCWMHWAGLDPDFQVSWITENINDSSSTTKMQPEIQVCVLSNLCLLRICWFSFRFTQSLAPAPANHNNHQIRPVQMELLYDRIQNTTGSEINQGWVKKCTDVRGNMQSP